VRTERLEALIAAWRSTAHAHADEMLKSALKS